MPYCLSWPVCILSILLLTAESGFGIENLNPSSYILARGPLKVSGANPRYFADDNGKAVYLTGSHTWDNFVDWGAPTPNFDYSAYLNFLQAHSHNLIRLWVHESSHLISGAETSISPLPWQRIGPGIAYDGKPKFDLEKFNPDFFDRLRTRIIDAQQHGIYVSIMLFNKFFHWPTHPFNSRNNINRLDGDLNGNGDGREIHTLSSSAVTAVKESYVQKVIDTVNDLDNVLYEIGNELRRDTIEWQYHMINFIHTYEAALPKQHPVGMTSTGGGPEATTNAELIHSPAEWISPRTEPDQDYSYDPPVADGSKVIISDTDHLWGVLGDPTPQWVWKSFLRGLNPILMDVIQNRAPGHEEKWNDPTRPSLSIARRAMGHTLNYTARADLATMVPLPNLSSTKYCLADPGAQYLIYVPSQGLIKGRGYGVVHWLSELSHESRVLQGLFQFIGLNETVAVDLSTASGRFNVEWFSPATGETVITAKSIGGTIQEFTAPFPGDAVLYIYRN